MELSNVHRAVDAEDRNASVAFLHYGDMTNIGDFLASPQHYFDFGAQRTVLIAGGGASNNFFAKRALRHKAKVRIAWAVGQSWPFEKVPSSIDVTLKQLLRRVTYCRASTRDPAMASLRLPLVPCPSAYHPLSELPPGTRRGIILNGNPRVSGSLAATMASQRGQGSEKYIFATNELGVQDFTDAFSRMQIVTTNSYHAAYWGLLSGRKVHIIGYSTKFTSLAKLFGFPESAVVKCSRGDTESLNNAIESCLHRAPLQLRSPAETRAQFRSLNLDFAERLSQVGVAAHLKPAFRQKHELALSA
ncbi:MAG: hypothetical protein C0519_05540 [Hyphomicrobium sp.]|nr:hypothetical protein [Hyphomicrobium sp.]PPD07613.1 MAG: hypothetical protein CTY28_09065 [Hyphomicrobium sp.]